MTEEDSEWRFGLDEVGPDDADADADADTGSASGGSVAGEMDYEMPVEPEPVELEHALFVLLGVTVTLVVFARFVVG